MLIQKHSGLVYNQLHKFNLIHDQEAESIAYEALYKALSNFDVKMGNKPSTVATIYIYNALGSYIRTLNKKRVLQVISYNNVAYEDDNGKHEFVDMLATPDNVEDKYIHKELQSYTRAAFNELYDMLTNEKHKSIIKAWNESDFEATTVEISKQIGISQSYVSQVINNFKFKMKKKLEGMYYD